MYATYTRASIFSEEYVMVSLRKYSLGRENVYQRNFRLQLCDAQSTVLITSYKDLSGLCPGQGL